MLKSFKKFLLPLTLISVSSGVLASVEPKNVIVFFLPVQDRAQVDSMQESVVKPVKTGLVTGPLTSNLPEPDKIQEKYGIITPMGASLYDKGATPLEQAADNVLAPVKVMVLPPENQKTGGTPVAGLPPSVDPVPVRIFPMTRPAEEIRQAAKERPVIVQYKPLRPPADKTEKRPRSESEWTGWILRQLEDCNMDSNTVLPTLYWMMANKKLTDGMTDCAMKTAVAGYLRKCHPWPVTYYTPVNNDVARRPAVQMAVEILENEFDTAQCPAIDLTGINFEKTDFLEGSLKGHDFSNSYFHEATFMNVDLSESLFEKAKMDNVLFQDVNMAKTYFKDVEMKYSHLHRVYAVMSNFENADMANTQFRDVNLSVSSFKDAKLQNTAWEDVKAYRVNADWADFSKAGFNNVLLTQLTGYKANFSKIVCKNCVFKQANLKEAQFYQAWFDNVSFKQASLYKAFFRDAVFETAVNFDDVYLYQANFTKVNLSLFRNVPIARLRQMKVDSRNLPQDIISEMEEDFYNLDIARVQGKPDLNYDRWSCTPKMCEDRLLGRPGNQNLAVRAMTLLSDDRGALDEKVWALCTVGCIARNDKKLENSQTDILSEYIRRRRPWSSEKDLFKPYEPIPADVQMALYVLTDPEIRRDTGHDIDLRMTDLRTADLSGADLRNVSMAGANLGGADLRGAKIDRAYEHFDQAVIDQFTRFPAGISSFQPYSLPDSATPPWWKPDTVRVFKDGTNLWTVTTEDIAFSEENVFPGKKAVSKAGKKTSREADSRKGMKK